MGHVNTSTREPVPVLFTHYGDDWIRGSERCLLDMFIHIDRARFRPILWCNGKVLEAEARRLDVTVHRDRFSMILHGGPFLADVANHRELVQKGRRLVEQHGIRLLHSNSAGPTQWLFRVARSARIPLFTHLHAPYSKRHRMILGIHQATLAAGVTRGCIEGLLEDGLPESRVTTIYNGVDTSPWKNHDETGLRARLGIGSGDLVLTQGGSLIHRKGHDILFRAFSELRRQHPNSHLLVVGDGPDRAKIESVARELNLGSSVHFLGFTEAGPGPVFRDATDIAVSPSRMEGFGLTVIEAGVSGRAVVATDTTGMREIITDGVSGIVVPIEDPHRLAEALMRLADDPGLRSRMGGALQRDVEERFLITRSMQNLQSAYDRLLAIPPSQLGWSASRWNGEFGMYARLLTSFVGRRLTRFMRPEPDAAATTATVAH